ncbi:hypothetical protein KFK09_017734 [Dendrobium nobile]|uniref:Uncharacterized protein n=1 Tax=Dendrobium nobile TaxID=94219 RepID=A0A8T3ATS2_DENNO|nr:hypothetical protein KFK09_017734 [Dendrobium nobile]
MNGRRTCCLNVSGSGLRCRLAKIVFSRRNYSVWNPITTMCSVVNSPRVAKMVPTVATANGNSPNLSSSSCTHPDFQIPSTRRGSRSTAAPSHTEMRRNPGYTLLFGRHRTKTTKAGRSLFDSAPAHAHIMPWLRLPVGLEENTGIAAVGHSVVLGQGTPKDPANSSPLDFLFWTTSALSQLNGQTDARRIRTAFLHFSIFQLSVVDWKEARKKPKLEKTKRKTWT